MPVTQCKRRVCRQSSRTVKESKKGRVKLCKATNIRIVLSQFFQDLFDWVGKRKKWGS